MDKLDKEQINLEGYNNLHKKQLVKDPVKNELMHKFIDKYSELLHKDHPLEEDKFQPHASQEETYNVLGALRMTQNKQKQQKQTNYIIEDPDELQVDFSEFKKEKYKRLKASEKHSQSVVMEPSVTPEIAQVKKRSKHRRTESINLDNGSVKKIMSMDFSSMGFKKS